MPRETLPRENGKVRIIRALCRFHLVADLVFVMWWLWLAWGKPLNVYKLVALVIGLGVLGWTATRAGLWLRDHPKPWHGSVM